MELMLSDHELGILLMGDLMNDGVPFHFVRPYVLNAAEKKSLEFVISRFQDARRDNHERGMFLPREHELTLCEASTLIAILETCLTECRGNSTSIHLYLHAEDEVRELISRMWSSI